jgi:YidC/Oxa1 family membrane protein insertase
LWLKWTYKHIVPNWGWAIVIQTLIITVALLPLRITQMKSMLKMQRIAPQIKSIQEKYKKYSLRDPRKAAMNEEISGLYKKEGVNPAGGCLPLLIQFPFLIAYYRMLGVALDLRHAHWLWVSDLSARDPYFILPILMVASMFAMQRMTPQAGMDLDDAADDGLSVLQLRSGIESLLCGDQFDFDGATGHHESNQAGPRDARDDGKARQEKREVRAFLWIKLLLRIESTNSYKRSSISAAFI